MLLVLEFIYIAIDINLILIVILDCCMPQYFGEEEEMSIFGDNLGLNQNGRCIPAKSPPPPNSCHGTVSKGFAHRKE